MRSNITACTHKILAGGLFGQVKSVIKKKFNWGVTLQFAPIKFGGGGSFWSSQTVIKKFLIEV